MEVCVGGELFDSIVESGSYSERKAAGVFRKMVDMLHHCHELGVMHRDLKPENFLLTSRSAEKCVPLSFLCESKCATSPLVLLVRFMCLLTGNQGTQQPRTPSLLPAEQRSKRQTLVSPSFSSRRSASTSS